MPEYGTWSPWAGSSVFVLAAILVVLGCILAYWGSRLERPLEVARPGKTVSALLIAMWLLSWPILTVAVATYLRALVEQVGQFAPPPNPVHPITLLGGLAAFILIAFWGRRHGLRTALGAAIVGTIAAPMIFELPFDLIVMTRMYSPQPAVQFTLLFFLPLFLLEIASFALLTLSPLTRLSKYTLFSLTAMLLVFAVWALFGFPYPAAPIPIALNGISKAFSFVAAVTLFLPRKADLTE